MTTDPILTVSQLNSQVKYLLEQSFPAISIEGEISNIIKHGSGHWYFSLKDEKAQVRCAMFRMQNRSVNFNAENGKQVLLRAKVALYEARGEFQLIVEQMEDAGVGLLQKQFEALKKKLAEEGLFNDEHKKSLPKIPTQIGVITSPTGAAIKDILRVLSRRMPCIPVVIYPSLVQGEQAADNIVQALHLANQRQECDVLLVSRGGGSIEDLWPFNEEIVARAIHASQIPVISGVGHEIDFTIADFVADCRAATPSAAAEISTPDKQALLEQINHYLQHLYKHTLQLYYRQSQHSDSLSKQLAHLHPQKMIAQKQEKLIHLNQQLHYVLLSRLQHTSQRLSTAMQLLRRHQPKQTLLALSSQLSQLQKDLIESITQRLNDKKNQLAQLAKSLHLLSPLAVLDRGYALTTATDGKLISSIKQVKTNDEIKIRLKDGVIEALVK